MKKSNLVLLLSLMLILILLFLTACTPKTPMPEVDWERCVIRELYPLTGTSFYEVHPDGTVDIYYSIAFDSMEAYLEHRDPNLALQRQISLSRDQFSEFIGLLNAIRKDGRLIPPPEPDESKRVWATDGVEISYYLDDDEIGAWNLVQYKDYPPEEYTAPWFFLWKLRRKAENKYFIVPETLQGGSATCP